MSLLDAIADKTSKVPLYCPYCKFGNTISLDETNNKGFEKRLCRRCKKKFVMLYEDINRENDKYV